MTLSKLWVVNELQSYDLRLLGTEGCCCEVVEEVH